MAGALLQPLLLLLLSFTLGSAAEAAHNNGERISNGDLCPRGAQPWQVALLMNHGEECVGVLIHSSWVLTVAHCQDSEYMVQMGSDLLLDPNAQRISAKETFVHPEFVPTGQVNDIMLVKLSSPAKLSSTVRTVDVPSSCKPDGTSCTVSGWGSSTEDKERNLAELMCTQTSILPIEKCKEDPRNMPKKVMLCAGPPKRRSYTCKVRVGAYEDWRGLGGGRKDRNGDMGSPLMCGGSLEGLFSTGILPCKPPLDPTSYTRVCAYHQWITDTMREHS